MGSFIHSPSHSNSLLSLTLYFTPSLIHVLICLLVHSLNSHFHMFKYSHIHALIYPLLHSFTPLLTHYFTPSLIHVFISLLIHSLTHILTHAITHLLTHPFTHPLTHSLESHFHPCINVYTHSSHNSHLLNPPLTRPLHYQQRSCLPLHSLITLSPTR